MRALSEDNLSKSLKGGMIVSNMKLAVIYYSSTGTNYQLAQWAAEGASAAGAEVKILKVQELAPESAIASNPAWKAHVEKTGDVPVATPDDLEWLMRSSLAHRLGLAMCLPVQAIP